MPRSLDPNIQSAIASGLLYPAILAQLTFRSSTQYVWSGIGSLVYNSQTYTGLGSLGKLGTITEGTGVRADGTSVGLSGIDPTLYSECMTDIQLGASGKIWFAVLTNGVIVGAPYLLFSGQVDKPSISTSPESLSISLALENRLTNLQRSSQRRYTAADQHIAYPDDTGFNWVEILNDIALVWGS